MDDHLKMCSDMMNMMQNMHGGMMPGQQNQKKQQQTTPPKQ